MRSRGTSRRRLVTALAALLTAAGWAGEASAATATLTLSGSAITFPDSNPELVPTITAMPGPITVTLRVTGNAGQSPWQLTIAAADHLRAGASLITANNVTWTSSKTTHGWLAGGTLAVAPAQTMAAGTGNSINNSSNITFLLANLWTFNPGTYATTATLSLSAP